MTDGWCCFVLFLYVYGWWPSYATAARVLFVVPTPSISHQIVYRPVAQELARRGHRVVVLTTDPAFPTGQSPPNLTEIDLHDVSYGPWIERFVKTASGKQNELYTQAYTAFDVMLEIFAKQMTTEAVQNLFADKKERFDLVIAEAWPRPALALSHVYRTPVILMSSFGAMDEQYELMGAPINPMLYPDFLRARIFNLTLWEKVTELYNRYQIRGLIKSYEEQEDVMLREVFGTDMPPIRELKLNVELLMVNIDPMFEGYRPVPPNVIHLGSLNCAQMKDLPQELEYWMNSSKHGVIYMSFGTNTDPALLPPDRMAIFARVFSQLPYDVLWKWKNPPAGLPANVRTSEWLPQPDLLRHKNLVLFITQAGLQSTDEALRAGVPLLAFPMLGDQWYNAEHYQRLGVGRQLDLAVLTDHQLREAIEEVINDERGFTMLGDQWYNAEHYQRLGVGRRLDLAALTDHQLREAIEEVINDQIYRERSKWLGQEMQDHPQSSLERAVWWIERTLRRRGPRMRAPAVTVCWLCSIEGDLLLAALALLTAFIFALYALYRIITKHNIKVKTK